MYVLSIVFTGLLTCSGAIAAPSRRAAPAAPLAPGKCTDFVFPVQASANNRLVFAPNLDLTTLTGVTSFLSSVGGFLGQLTSFIPEAGTYNISATYCAPETTGSSSGNGSIPAERASHVQLLLHGLPYSRNYWTGLGAPFGTPNNWLQYASAQGYPVLSIDNLGHGDSSRPEPTLVVQQALQTVIVQEIISMLRNGSVAPGLVAPASKVIFVGHSIGSVTGNGVASKYPNASFDAAVLTGYTYTVVQGVVGLLSDQIEPAELQSPRFANLTDPGYLTFASEEGKRNTYYGTDDSFLQAYPSFDVNFKQDTITTGEIVSVLSGLEMAKGYKGDVFVLTGDQDALFCGLGSRDIQIPSCTNSSMNGGSGNIVAKSQAFWPDARSYEYYVVPEAGHSVTLHKSAQTQFQKVHDFLAKQGY